jgi:PEP-CTERM motif-containing protein
MRKKAGLLGACCGLSMLLSNVAHAMISTVDFNSPNFFGDGVFVPAGSSFSTQRFTFTAVGGANDYVSVDTQANITNNGSPRLFAGNQTEIVMWRPSGRAFDLLGLDYGGSWTDVDKRSRWADSIEIIGVFANGNTVQTSLSLAGLDPTLHTVTFQGFCDLDAVIFRGLGASGVNANNREFVLDNMVVNVPEPQTYALFLTGLGLLAWRFRAKH